MQKFPKILKHYACRIHQHVFSQLLFHFAAVQETPQASTGNKRTRTVARRAPTVARRAPVRRTPTSRGGKRTQMASKVEDEEHSDQQHGEERKRKLGNPEDLKFLEEVETAKSSPEIKMGDDKTEEWFLRETEYVEAVETTERSLEVEKIVNKEIGEFPKDNVESIKEEEGDENIESFEVEEANKNVESIKEGEAAIGNFEHVEGDEKSVVQAEPVVADALNSSKNEESDLQTQEGAEKENLKEEPTSENNVFTKNEAISMEGDIKEMIGVHPLNDCPATLRRFKLHPLSTTSSDTPAIQTITRCHQHPVTFWRFKPSLAIINIQRHSVDSNRHSMSLTSHSLGNILSDLIAVQGSSSWIMQKLKEHGIESILYMKLVSDPWQEWLNRGFAFLQFLCHAEAMLAFKRLQKPDDVFGHAKRTAKVAFAEPLNEPNPDVMAQVKSVSWMWSLQIGMRKGSHEAAVACVDDITNRELGDMKVILTNTEVSLNGFSLIVALDKEIT
ncbi:uncharacterized protein LOC124931527 [Impatiens glandulifera]|uniref:uncharacterized protein LOC124931527 n=1 Tax=Impatiens glandulifera TaxID=253017 RepID=UPI001FB116B2|nr:uncharacterized protein LOC124931527 [Impatiens glandulifera]